ncbi:MAG TPA: hypothetical protein VGE07_28605 [Herpetosiphonaceae bacterium]
MERTAGWGRAARRRISRALAALMLAALVLTIPGGRPAEAQQQAIRPVSWWQNRYDASWPGQREQFLPLSTSVDSWDHYNLAYAIDGPTAMYLATGNTTYLDQALVFANNLRASARPSKDLGPAAFRDSFMGWTSFKNGQTGNEVPLFESYAWRYVTRLLRVIRLTPALYANPGYRQQYDRLLAFAEVNLFDKWHARGVNAYVYRVNANMASHWAFIAMDLSLMTTDPARLAKLRAVFDNINHHMPVYGGASLHGQMIAHPLNPGALFWDDEWGTFERPGQDVGHANNVLAYIVEAQGLGMGGWTRADMAKFCVLFDKIVWPAATTYAEFVDGSGGGSGWFTEGFMKLGRYDAAIQRRLESHGVAEGVSMFGNGALNAKILAGTTPRAFLPLVGSDRP